MSRTTCMRFNTLPNLQYVKCSFHNLNDHVGFSTHLHLRFQLKHFQIKSECIQQLWCVRDGDVQGKTMKVKESHHRHPSTNYLPFITIAQYCKLLILKKLRRYGLSGILSYGLLNTVYYLSAFLVAWFYIAPAPGKMGYLTAVKRFVKLMAMVWAGSQVTKLVRAGGALALAPVVDKGLSWFMAKFKFRSQAKAFSMIVGCCFGVAAVLFIVVTLLSA